MSASIEARRLGFEDVDLAREMICAVKYNGESSDAPSLDSADMDAWLSRSYNVLIAATQDGIPVGFALGYLLSRVDAARVMLFFYEIEVAASYRKRGIGGRLIEAMKTIAQEEDALKMWVQADPDNMAARALYRSMGGTESMQANLLYVWTNQTLSDPSVPSSELHHPQ